MSDSDEDLAALDTICAQEYLMFVRDIGYGLIICRHLQLFKSDMLLAADLTSCLWQPNTCGTDSKSVCSGCLTSKETVRQS